MTLKRFKRKIDKILGNSILKLSKRPRFVITTILLTGGLILTQLLPMSQSFVAVFLLGCLSLFLTLWCLWEELDNIEYLTLLILPVLYTVGVCLFYYLLPLRWITRMPVGILYAIGIYAILLTENIFNVAAIRTIALLRAAKAVSLLFSLITAFFLFNTLFSFHLNSLQNSVTALLITFIITLSNFWAEKLTPNLEKNIILYSLSASLIVMEIAFVLSFWPIKGTFESLYIVSILYTIMSIIENKLKEMPLHKSMWEYLFLNILAIVMLIKMSNWQI